MDKERIEYFKSRLLEEREKTLDSIKNIEKRTQELEGQVESELSTYENHPADSGTELYLKEQDYGFEEQLKETLEEIERSLADIEKERYGYCDNCQKMISEERLEVLPYAKTCLACSDGEETEIKDRSNEDEILEYKKDTSEETLGYSRKDGYRDTFKDNVVPNDPSYSTGDKLGIEDERDEYEITEEIEELTYQEDEDDLR